MADLVERQEAIDSVEGIISSMSVCINTDECKGMNRMKKRVIENLTNLPSAQPSISECWGCNCQKMERLKEQKTFSEMVHLHDAERREEWA